MRHRMRGRKLGRNASHRKAMFRNMATSLIKTLDPAEDVENRPKVAGRIITTVPKAKELRPRIEKLITLAKKAAIHEQRAQEFVTDAEKGSDAWKEWRNSERWQTWTQAMAPAVALRRRAFATLRDRQAVDILFSDLAERFVDRNGGYTRVVKLATVRLGDAGQQALIEFVGENDRVKTSKKGSLAVKEEPSEESAPGVASGGEPVNSQDTEGSADNGESSEGEATDSEKTDE
jgi:large subunit ribosomal protein L17